MAETLTFQPIAQKVGRQETDGTRIGLRHLQPTMLIDVFPHKVTVDQGGTQVHELFGPTGYRWGGHRLLVNARSEDGASRLLVNHHGQVLFAHDPIEPVTVERALALTPGQYSRDELDFTERYSRLDVTDPSTFEEMSYGEVFLFVRTERGLTQKQLADELLISVPILRRIEQGKQLSWYSIGSNNDPLHNIAYEACKRDRAARGS